MPFPSTWGNEFLVNTTTKKDQTEASVAMLSDGRFVIAWKDESRLAPNKDTWGVRAQVFKADGSKDGSEFTVNQQTSLSEYGPHVAALSTGGFAIAYQQFDHFNRVFDSFVALFGANGQRDGNDFLLHSHTADDQQDPAIAGTENGGFVSVLTDNGGVGTAPDTSATGIMTGVFNGSQTRILEGFFNETKTGGQSAPVVVDLPGDNFFIAYTDGSGGTGDTSGNAVRGVFGKSTGPVASSEVLINTTTANDQGAPDAALLSNGKIIVVWTDNSQSPDDASGRAVRGQILNSDGTKSGGEFLINTTTSDDQINPRVAALPTGGFVVVWEDWSEWTAANGINARGQVFHTNGSKNGDEFKIGQSGGTLADTYDQGAPDVSALFDGRFVVTWGDGTDTKGDPIAIHAQIYDSRSSGVTVKGNKFGNDLFGTGFKDSLRGFSGNDTLTGDKGNDLLAGGKGADRLFGGNDNDKLLGDAGGDLLQGDKGNDRLFGGGEKDKLFGADGRDRLFGDTGNDRLDGGNDKDLLDGGANNDILTGGGGNDTFIYNGGRDKILDFRNNRDTIALDRKDLGLAGKSVGDVLDMARVKKGDVLIKFAPGDVLILDGFTKIAALSDDLAFV